MNDNAISLNQRSSNSGDEPISEVSSPKVSSVVRVLPDDRLTARLGLVEDRGSAWAVAWPGAGSHLRSMHRISLSGGGATKTMRHPMEAVYYVISGDLTVEDSESGMTQKLVARSMAFIEAHTGYRFVAGEDGSELVGGPCPPDPGVYKQLIGD